MNTQRTGLRFGFTAVTAACMWVMGVTITTAMTPGGTGPACTKRVDVPQDSQSNVQAGCTSWTECDDSWQCATVSLGPQLDCGDEFTTTRYCRDCTGGVWDGDTQRCEMGISGSCSADYASGTRTRYLEPSHCP